MGIFNDETTSTTGSGSIGQQGPQGPPGVGFILTDNGDYNLQNKKMVNVKQGTNPNDAVTKSQIQLFEGAQPGTVVNNKSVIYSKTGSVHTNSIYLQDTPDNAGSSNDVRLMTEHQSYKNIHLHIPDLQNFDGDGGRAKSEIMVTSTEQHITGRKTFFDINVLKPDNDDQAANKKYVDDSVKKIPALDTSDFIKKDGSVAMTDEFDAGNQKIKNISTPKANESDKAANVDFVVKEINNSNSNITQQYKDWVAQSHLISSHKTNEFKYLYDTDESASEYNIRVNGFENNFRESAHQNKKAYSITMTKDSGSNDYRSGISFNIYPLPIGTFTMIFEYYFPESTNVSLFTVGTTVYIHKQVYRAFDTYGKLLVQINNNSKNTPDRITL